jgi:predicted nucleic acid-binding protein
MRTSNAWNPPRKRQVYLIDTNIVSETRKKERANPGVLKFFDRVVASGQPVYLSVVSVGELRRGVELIRHRGETDQAKLLEAWLTMVLDRYGENILAFEADAAQVWGRLRVPNPGHELDKQIAAIALVNDLTVVTRNTADFEGTGVKLINPFLPVVDKL